jgi:hypothetical protein
VRTATRTSESRSALSSASNSSTPIRTLRALRHSGRCGGCDRRCERADGETPCAGLRTLLQSLSGTIIITRAPSPTARVV